MECCAKVRGVVSSPALCVRLLAQHDRGSNVSTHNNYCKHREESLQMRLYTVYRPTIQCHGE